MDGENIITNEARRLLATLDLGAADFAAQFESGMRARLAARATLGDVEPSYVCPAGHIIEWTEATFALSEGDGLRHPIVVCPECANVDAVKADPSTWIGKSLSLAKPHLAWIHSAASKRLAEIKAALTDAVGDELSRLQVERRIVSSLASMTKAETE